MDSVIGNNGDTIFIARNGIGFGDLKDIVQIYDRLGNGIEMIVNTVRQFPVIEEHKPSSLPTLRSGIIYRKLTI